MLSVSMGWDKVWIAATNVPIFHPPDMSMEHGGMISTGRKELEKKTCSSPTLSTTSTMWTYMGAHPGFSGERPARTMVRPTGLARNVTIALLLSEPRELVCLINNRSSMKIVIACCRVHWKEVMRSARRLLSLVKWASNVCRLRNLTENGSA
jgi:hypothetical protein